MVIRALVVDDEPPARDELVYLLSAHPDVEVLEAGSATAALQMIRAEQPDLVFQDIQMSGKDGFHVLEMAMAMPEPPLFVFVTAFDQYAVQAFEENAVDYLLKPVAAKRLAKSMERVRALLGGKRATTERGALRRLLEGMGRRECLCRLPVEQGGRIRLIPTADVVLVEAEGKRLTAMTDAGPVACHGQASLAGLEERLESQGFFRANRSVLVNLERIGACAPWFGGKYHVEMNDKARTKVTVSRNRVRDFKTRLGL
ncbi:MAG: LytR/AlgR family response regulator transcription factor [Desulfovibrionaceae bacterium]